MSDVELEDYLKITLYLPATMGKEPSKSDAFLRMKGIDRSKFTVVQATAAGHRWTGALTWPPDSGAGSLNCTVPFRYQGKHADDENNDDENNDSESEDLTVTVFTDGEMVRKKPLKKYEII